MTVFRSSDKPQFDQADLKLCKFIPEGKSWTKKYLKDAEYTVRYYPEFYNTAEEIADIAPMKTWVFRSDGNGVIKMRETDPATGHQYYTGGDTLFKDENGIVVCLYGTYVFEETKAPPGFVRNKGVTIRQIKQNEVPLNIDDKNNDDTVNVAREYSDSSIKRSITVTKKLWKKNYYEPYGNPTFIFKCEGSDIYGNKHIFYKSVTIKESDFTRGSYKGSVTFNNLPPGEYTVTEEETMRYILKSITDVTPNGNISRSSAWFELVNSYEGRVTFENKIRRWDNYSDTECIVNHFQEGRIL